MWSTEFNGGHSAYSPQQRLLFPVRVNNASTNRCLMRSLEHGTCTGVAVLNPDDRGVLLLARQALHAAYATTTPLQRSIFSITVVSSSVWTIATLSDRVQDVIGHLQVESLDVILLARPLALNATLTTSERKKIVLQHWEAMCLIQRRGLVHTMGLNDFTTQEMEFIFTASPEYLPTVLSMDVRLASQRSAGHRVHVDVPFRALLSFAHGHRMDVVVRFTYHALEQLPLQHPLRQQWQQVVDKIGQRQRRRQFDVQVVHEAEVEPYHLEKRNTEETDALQTNAQVILRYFLQKGVVVMPLPDSDESADQFTEDEAYELFYRLVHPFATIPPAHSPQVQYDSVLSKDDLRLIDQVLPLVVSISQFEEWLRWM